MTAYVVFSGVFAATLTVGWARAQDRLDPLPAGLAVALALCLGWILVPLFAFLVLTTLLGELVCLGKRC